LRVTELVIDFLADVDRRARQMTGRCLVRLLKQIRKPLGIEMYRPIVGVVKKQEDHLTFRTDVYRSRFLEVCIVEPLAEMRLALFESGDRLYDLVGRVVSIHEAEKSRPALVLALLEMSDRQDLAWQFFAKFPTHRNVGAILSSPGPKKFSLFLAAFQKSENYSKVFVSSTCLPALSSALPTASSRSADRPSSGTTCRCAASGRRSSSS
jgi:hypothetical protein